MVGLSVGELAETINRSLPEDTNLILHMTC
jgi:hypothetical protein